MLALASFPQFSNLPLEIQSLVLDQCPPNDRVCLSLANRTLYALAGSLPSTRLSLSHIDPLPRTCICTLHEEEGDENEKPAVVPTKGVERVLWCHMQKQALQNRERRALGKREVVRSSCRTAKVWWRGDQHCYCGVDGERPLYRRLRSWVPRGLNYCGQCDKWTRRTRSHGGRCKCHDLLRWTCITDEWRLGHHGLPRPTRRRTNNLWMHHSRKGAFGHKIWKFWFNNAAHNSFEARLRDGVDSCRRSASGHNLRTLRMRDIDTSVARGFHG